MMVCMTSLMKLSSFCRACLHSTLCAVSWLSQTAVVDVRPSSSKLVPVSVVPGEEVNRLITKVGSTVPSCMVRMSRV